MMVEMSSIMNLLWMAQRTIQHDLKVILGTTSQQDVNVYAIKLIKYGASKTPSDLIYNLWYNLSFGKECNFYYHTHHKQYLVLLHIFQLTMT